MSRQAQIVDAVTGKVDQEMDAWLDVDQHADVFAQTAVTEARHPLLSRLRDYHASSHFRNQELDRLIAELEMVSALFEYGHRTKDFLGPFHTVCCLALCRGEDVVVHGA